MDLSHLDYVYVAVNQSGELVKTQKDLKGFYKILECDNADIAEWALNCVRGSVKQKGKFKVPNFRSGWGLDTKNKLDISIWVSNVLLKTIGSKAFTIREIDVPELNYLNDFKKEN